jgi:O-antigen/teichoic acid export membrane protein
MEKALEMGKTSAAGSFHIFIGVSVSTVIMAVGTILLGRFLGGDAYGLYTVTLVPALMIGLFRDWGVNSAMTKYIASLRLENDDAEIRNVIVAGLVFEVAVGLALLFFSLLSANFIASALFHRPESASLISIVSLSIFGGSLFTASQSSFVGFERMKLNSFITICQAIVKTAVGPVLVLLGYGVLGAVLGYTASFLLAGLIGLATLYFAVLRRLRKENKKSSGLSNTLKRMLKYGLPLSVSALLGGALTQFYGFMMASFVLDNNIIGNYQVGINFAVLLTFLSVPISTVLFPAFAKLDPENEHELVRNIFTSSVKYTALVVVPATMAIMVLSKPMISTLYGDAYVNASFFLTLYVVANLLAVFGSLSLGSFLAGLGETRMAMNLGIITIAFGLPSALILIPTYGILGVIIGSVISGMPSLLWGLYWVWKHYGAKADFKCSAKIFTASAIAAAATYASLNFIYLAEWIKLVAGITIFLAIYIFTAPTIGAVTQTDINNLRSMLSGLGIVSKMVNIPLRVAEEVAKIRIPTKSDKTSTRT